MKAPAQRDLCCCFVPLPSTDEIPVWAMQTVRWTTVTALLLGCVGVGEVDPLSQVTLPRKICLAGLSNNVACWNRGGKARPDLRVHVIGQPRQWIPRLVALFTFLGLYILVCHVFLCCPRPSVSSSLVAFPQDCCARVRLPSMHFNSKPWHSRFSGQCFHAWPCFMNGRGYDDCSLVSFQLLHPVVKVCLCLRPQMLRAVLLFYFLFGTLAAGLEKVHSNWCVSASRSRNSCSVFIVDVFLVGRARTRCTGF